MNSVVFLHVKDNHAKQKMLFGAIQNKFEQQKRILIAVPNDQAAQYMDQLLWQFLPESFLPHCITLEPTDEPIAITTLHKNLNQASILFNLCPEISTLHSQFETIYELLDATRPDKLSLSQKRQQDYVKAGCNVHCPE